MRFGHATRIVRLDDGQYDCVLFFFAAHVLYLFVCSANSSLTTLDVFRNPMSDVVHKAIKLGVILCQLRNPTVTEVDATYKGFNDQDANKIGEGLRCVLDLLVICL